MKRNRIEPVEISSDEEAVAPQPKKQRTITPVITAPVAAPVATYTTSIIPNTTPATTSATPLFVPAPAPAPAEAPTKRTKEDLTSKGRGDNKLVVEVDAELDSEKTCTRTILLRATMKLDAVHTAIQQAFGWKGQFAYRFVTDDGLVMCKTKSRKGDVISEKQISINMLLPDSIEEDPEDPPKLFTYEYLGEAEGRVTWKVNVYLVRGKMLRSFHNNPVPRCVGGEGSAPTEGLKSIREYERKEKDFGDSDIDKINKKMAGEKSFKGLFHVSTSAAEVERTLNRCLRNPMWWSHAI